MSSLRVQRILKAHRIRKLSVDEVHAALKTAPLVLAPGAAEAASKHVQFLLPQVKLLEEQLREVSNRIKNLLTVMIEESARTNQPPFPSAGVGGASSRSHMSRSSAAGLIANICG